jgi:hypothetical protein
MHIDETFRPQIAKLELDELAQSADVTYLVDSELRLRGYNDAWRRFALNNAGATVLKEYPFGRSILDAMSPQPRDYYAAAYRRALARQIRFDHHFECPSASHDRRLQQSAYPLAGAAGLIVINHLVCEVPIERTGALPSLRYVNPAGLVVQCCHCRRAQDQTSPHKWDWVPQWVERPHPSTSHGLCPGCYGFYYRSMAPPEHA